jgi:tetratricopeptide (TPR) repeat protein
MMRMQAMAEYQQSQLFKKAAAASQRLAAGDAAYQEGNIRLASSIYTRLAYSQPRNDGTWTAGLRLEKLAEEARTKLKAVDDKLVVSVPATTEQRAKEPAGGRASPETVIKAFEEYDRIVSQYGKVPAVRRELPPHVAKQRRQFADILNETQAKELWEMGQEHEKTDQLCCAYLAYQQAARLTPAESALKAKGRFETLKNDPNVVASAEACRELRECHKTYQRAAAFVKVMPDRALELYADILRRAPKDSDLFRQVQSEHDALKQERSAQ